jgi:hypothetical protein
MTFLQPFILWGLPVVLLPILIHLLNRMRHRSQPWAAMQFLVSATRSSVNNARLRQWLILLFRVLAVLMLVLFLSRPLAGGWLGWALSPAPDTILILLDRSASMEAQAAGSTVTKRELALRSLIEAAKPFEQTSHLVLIDSALRTPQEIGRATSLKDFSLTSPTDTAADIPGLLSVALNWLVENKAGAAEVWLASDLQRSNWHPDDARWPSLIAQFNSLPQNVRVRLLAMDQPSEENRAISLKEVLRHGHGKLSELRLTVDVEANARQSESIPLTLNLDGARTQTELKLEGQSVRWRHKLNLGEKTASGWGSVELPADGNRRDNTAYFVYGPEKPLHASIISSDPHSVRLTQLAIGAAAAGALDPEVHPATELEHAVWEDDALLVWQESLPSGALAQRLRAFVEQGGDVLFLPTGRSDAQRFEGLGWGEVESTDAAKPFHVGRWNEEEGPLAKSDEGLNLPLGQAVFLRRQLIAGAKNVLAAFDDGRPFLARQTLGRGEILFGASLPDNDWSSLGDGQVLVPMVQRLLQSGSRRLQQAASISCGELSVVDQAQRWEPVDSKGAKEIQTQAGVYRSGTRLLAVNRPSDEDDPELLEGTEAKRLFSPLSVQMLQDRNSDRENLQGEIWRALVTLMLLFLIVEGWLMLPPRPAHPVSAPGSAGPGSEKERVEAAA